MALTGLNLIGNISSGKGTTTFFAANPSTSKNLDTTFIEATNEEVNMAVEKAESAFSSYSSKTSEERARFLETIADEILALGDELISRCMAETALPEGRLIGERGRTMNQLKLFAKVVRDGSWADLRIDTALPDRKPLPRSDIRQMQLPLGPVGIFGASNFPLAFSVAGGDTASALAAGCPVVVKAHPLHPGTSELVGMAILNAARKTQMPDGVFSLIQGPSVEVGMAIVLHPKITAIGFTGSFRGGKAIFDAANKRSTPIPVFAEMGSSNPVFILPGILKKEKSNIAKGLAGSLTLGVGQFCTNPGLLIMDQSDDANDFLKELGEQIKSSTPGTMLSAGIKNNYTAGVNKLTEAQGVSLVASSSETETGNHAQSNVFTTGVHTFMQDHSLEEEVFGPTLLNVSTGNKAEMIKLAESLEGHLTATIHGTAAELQEYSDLIKVLERKVGRIIFNGFPTGVEVCDAMVHGGPYPATTAPQTTSVGTAAIKRFARPVCYQDFPQSALPVALRDENPLKLWRLVNGEWRRE
ncbi:MAG: 2,5-dioxovalerate dehydrogenase [Saprospiraceae bacterium]|nr:MAG: 2,5-dioxovalerate dehydrogenase [Saprospiraceae bacterium]